jgi:aromatic-L-amino-acid/L-tryptophan decarboxylase
LTPDEFRRAGHQLVEWIAAYRERLARGEFPVQSPLKPGELLARLPRSAPEDPEAMERIFADLDALILPGITHWQHPRFFGYFPTGGSLSSVLGDMASTGLAVIGLNWQASPALTELEQAMMQWMRELLDLPAEFSGVIQDTASTASFIAMVCARERASGFASQRSGLHGESGPLVVYLSSQAHSSVEKAALLAGIGRRNVRQVPVDAQFRMDPDALRQAIRRDRVAGMTPCAVVATTGTTATTAIDPLEAIGAIALEEDLWLHVDAAMGGAAAMLPEMRRHFNGIGQADSIIVNSHKWLGVAFDCTLYYVRDPQHLIRVMSTNPSYLQTPADAQVRNYRDWGVPLGRRFRALKLWLTLREEGAAAIRARLRRDIENARWLESAVRATAGWQVLAPVTLQTVCVRHTPAGLSGEALDRHTQAWAQAINASGKAYVTPARLDERWMVRVSVGSALTQRPDVEALWQMMQATAADAAG